jgi:CRISPR-associated protein Cas5d
LGYGFKLHVWGDRALFTRPEMKGERVSYDVMTPSAARGVLEAIYWKPAIRWVVDRITVLNPIAFDSIRRNELGGKVPPRNVTQAMNGGDIDLHQYITEDRQQRASLCLRNVAYLIDAHFELVQGKSGEGDTVEKHYNIALRRMRAGQCFHRPYFGCREFPVSFALIEDDREAPRSAYAGEAERDLGWMLFDLDFSGEVSPKFFRATMRHGIVDLREGVAI